MKGDIYKYEGKEFVLEGKYYDEYLGKTGVDAEKEYSNEEATSIMNINVMAVYQGLFTCRKPLTGKEICNILSDIREQFEIRCDVEFES